MSVRKGACDWADDKQVRCIKRETRAWASAMHRCPSVSKPTFGIVTQGQLGRLLLKIALSIVDGNREAEEVFAGCNK